jgi:sulfofructose kinase
MFCEYSRSLCTITGQGPPLIPTVDGGLVPALDVLCVGSATHDTIVVVPSVPGDDVRMVVDTFVVSGGGPAATAAVALARLGATVGFCGVVGDDDAGHEVRDGLASEGVVLDWLRVVPGATTRSLVLVSESTGGRTIVTQQARPPLSEDVPVDLSTWIHADQTGIGPARRALVERSASALLSIDGGNPLDLTDLAGVELYAPSVPALLARYPGATTVRGALDRALADGATWVIATDGPRGAHVRSADLAEQVPAYHLPVVSTLGAGDVFHGALLAAIIAGSSVPHATREACAAAALSCRSVDGRSAIPRRDELDSFLKRERASDRSGSPVT